MKTVAVIPCYNEEIFVSDIVARAKKYVTRVVVADDCSTDRTSALARKAGAFVAQSNVRRGFGGNLLFGIKVALVTGDEDIVVTLDGDGQHRPEEIPDLVDPIRQGQADIIIGSRFLKDYDCPAYRKFGIDLITWLYNLGYGQKIVDAQSCLRAYRREVFDDVKLLDRGFGFSTEVLIKARCAHYRIREVPVTCIYHKDWHLNSTMNPIKQGLIVLLATLKWRLRK